MTEISKRERTAEWVCRILITLDLYLVASGYISFFQAKHQLISPLIPQSTLYEVTEIYMEDGLITSIVFLAGLWFYFFRKRIVAIILLCLAAFSYEIIFILFRK